MESGAGRKGTGWVGFAGVMFALAGAFNVIDGLTALFKDEYFREELLFGDITLWGVVALGMGILQWAISLAIFNSRPWALIGGITLAMFNAILQLGWFVHFPLWSGAIIVIDVLVIYALTVYGDVYREAS